MNCSIVGMSIRLPQGLTQAEFWQALVAETSFLEGMSPARQVLHQKDQSRNWEDLAKVKGMYLEEIDCFDRRLFKMSNPAVMFADPRQRLLLESCWSAIEDAGIKPSDLKGQKVGVFIAHDGFDMASYFRNIPAGELNAQEFIIPGNVTSFLANRISNVFDFKGPSMVVDSTCSSIYVAIHHARKALESSECDYAIVGGVTLFLEPWKTGAIRPTSFETVASEVKSFSKDAAGYCSSEGCGAILLQRSNRETDKTHSSYGTIIGSGFNSGGKTDSFAKPNQQQQEILFQSILDSAQKTVAEVSYIEAHGIGSEIGDAIEATALINVFGQESDSPCYVSTIKPNIGHTHAASGLYSLLKALLSIKYGQLLGIKGLSAEKLTTKIAEGQKGIEFLTKTIDWPKQATQKRVVLLSSYGFSNVNAAILLEEASTETLIPVAAQEPVLVCLSAESKEQLTEQQIRLLADVREIKTGLSLKSLAYTLQIGREAMRYRFAVLVKTIADLELMLSVAPKLSESTETILLGDSKQAKSSIDDLLSDKTALDQLLIKYFERSDLLKLAELWVNGINIKWDYCYQKESIQRLHLPSYPFAREKFWIPTTKGLESVTSKGTGRLHPLLHYNSSTLEEQQFTTLFIGTENFLIDHEVNKTKIFPGAAYLELVREAGARSLQKPITQIKDLIWLVPKWAKGTPKNLYTSLAPWGTEIRFEVFSLDGKEKVLHSQGSVSNQPLSYQPEKYDIATLKKRFTKVIAKKEWYEKMEHLGLVLGDCYTGVSLCYHTEQEALAKINFPKEEGYVLSVGIMDSTLQTCVGWLLERENYLALPFGVGQVNIYQEIPEGDLWAYARKSKNNKADSQITNYDIDLLNAKGEVLIGFKEFVIRSFDGQEKIRYGNSSIDSQKTSELAISAQFRTSATEYLIKLFSKELRTSPEEVEIELPFENYGIDSVLINQLTNRLEQVFGRISRTLFFEYKNLGQVIDYFIENYTSHLEKIVEHRSKTVVATSSQTTIPVGAKQQRFLPQIATPRIRSVSSPKTDIAIIGLSGEYPDARNIQELWENLQTAKYSITEIPKDRWDIEGFYDKKEGTPGKSNSKWGGFIKDFDKFDPLFFNISPREAELLDPQVRRFLQVVWATIEDAGYSKESINKASDKEVGVYVGVMYNDYQLFGVEETLKANPMAMWGIGSSVANRVSYFYDFQGPSMAIDTMCSSSLTAIHLACESIQNGNCQVAIAGGVNLSLHPNKYRMLSQSNFLSSQGKCESFGKGGDGYVPSEGVGAVLLKSLAQAQQDGDRIYGVIKGSSLNHGGRTNGFTVPNPTTQASVIEKAIKRAGVTPDSFSYIEAHGTGTSLGDPIEIAGLSKAFRSHTKEGQYCRIGSIKSNIGHAESAAGIAGVTKILLQLQHKKLVPSLHSSILNEHIDFAETPFKVQQDLEEWAVQEGQLRLAGLSSFGAGGSNAHLIIEEYQQEKIAYQSTRPVIIVLSAKNKERLAEQVSNLSAFLEKEKSINLYDIAYTLQVGRTAMEERLALVVNDLTQLQEQLQQYKNERTTSFFTGNIKKDKLDFLLKGNAGKGYIEIAIREKEIASLAQLWVKGVAIDWTLLYEGSNRPNKISLPTYPFARKRYWIEQLPKISLSNTTKQLFKNQQEPKPIGEIDEIILLQPEWALSTTPSSLSSKNSRQFIVFVGASTKQLYETTTQHKNLSSEWLSEIAPFEYMAHLYSVIEACKGDLPSRITVVHNNKDWEKYRFIVGLFKTLTLSNSKLSGQLLGLELDSIDNKKILDILKTELEYSDVEVRYINGNRSIRGFIPVTSKPVAKKAIVIKENGVYIITGGAGGIGLLLAEYLSTAKKDVKTLLIGRSAYSEAISKKMKHIEQAIYYSCDITQKEALAKTIDEIRSIYGNIDGIIHSAGSSDFNFSDIDLTKVLVSNTLKSKIKGCEYLDELTKNDALDFMIYCSSISGTIDNFIGFNFSHYPLANAFLDQFSYSRNQAVKQGRRQGQTISINWPIWQVGMYSVDSDKWVEKKFGIKSLTGIQGKQAFEKVLSNPASQVMVLYGEKKHLLENFSLRTIEKITTALIQPVKINLPALKRNTSEELEFQAICHKGALQVLIGLGIENHTVGDLTALRQQLQIIDKYERLFNELIRRLTNNQYLFIEEGKIIVPQKVKIDLSTFNWTTATNKLQLATPDYRASSKLTGVCLASFIDILTGKVKATDIIFPAGSMDLVAGIYKDNQQADYYNDALCQFVEKSIAESIAKLADGEKITILEVGAGTGGTSAVLFKALAKYKDHIRYIYTDVSKSFLFYAEEYYKDLAPYLETKLFNIEKSPEQQGISLGNCDLVIGANVVHATKNIANSLQNIKAVLKKEGVLLLNEIAQTELFATLTFGLLDGWWLYEDVELRMEGSPGLSYESWQKVLTQRGYINTYKYPIVTTSAQQIIIAQSNGTIVLNSTNYQQGILKQQTTPSFIKRSSKQELDSLPKILLDLAATTLKLPAEEFDIEEPFADYGFDSILGAQFINKLNDKLSIKLLPIDIFNYPNIKVLSDYISENFIANLNLIDEEKPSSKGKKQEYLTFPRTDERSGYKTPTDTILPKLNGFHLPHSIIDVERDSIAIIGVSGLFPDGLHPSSLETTIEKPTSNLINKKQWNAINEEVLLTNAVYVGLTQVQLKKLSRRHQLIISAIGLALKAASISYKTLSGTKTGVFIAVAENFTSSSDAEESYLSREQASSLLPSSLSYHLNLIGPSEVISSACVSSFHAIHKAIASIEQGECEIAIVGAVNIIDEKTSTYGDIVDLTALLSKQGCMKSFDEAADGIIRSEGIGVLLLQKKSIAERETNKIYGLIKGSSLVHGGKNISWEAPNPKGIKEAIKRSLSKATITADSIDYIEAHGIANPMADAIELTAIEAAYNNSSKDSTKKWHVGSIKPTIGHSEVASGMASLIKVLKAFEQRTIPGIAGLETVNAELPSNHSLILTKENTYWKNGKHPRRAALNSYAVGGVNAHIIIEEYVGKDQDKAPSSSSNSKLEVDKKSQSLQADEVVSNKSSVAQGRFRETILAIAKATFKTELDLKRSPIDYGFDSVKVIRFVRRVNEHFEITAKMGQILSAETFEEMFDLFATLIEQGESPKEEVLSTPSFPTRYPLSEGQKGLWSIQAAQPESIIYNVPIALCLEEFVAADSIYQAAEKLLAAHPILQVRFKVDTDTGTLYQELSAEGLSLIRDVAALSEDESIDPIFQKLVKEPFDLAQEVVRLHIRTDLQKGKTYLLFVIHHIVIDGTSIIVLLKEFTHILQSLQRGNPLTLKVNRNYFDFITWEQEHIESKQGEAAIAYWKEKLNGALEKIALPYDTYVEQDTPSLQEGKASFSITGTELASLKAAAKAQKVNLSIFLLAVFKVLLYRLTSTEDIIIKQPTAGRPKEKYDASIGYYVNMMLSRTSLSGDQSFEQVVAALQKELLQSIDHVSYPYPKLLADLDLTGVERDGLFPVSFNYLNVFDELLEAGNQQTGSLMENIQQAITDEYALEISDLRNELIIELSYRSDLFAASTIQRHLGYYQRILETVIHQIDAPIGRIDILSEAERQQLLIEFNDTYVDFPEDKTIIDLFEEQVEKTPNNIAVVFEETQLTYQQLNEQANKIGHHLRTNYQIQSDDIIALQLERSEWMIIAILGVLKSGAAYLPIAPDVPKARAAFMLQDARAKVLITDETTYITVFEHQAIIALETIEQIKSQKKENLERLTTDKDLAYIIYTSGSTGTPKGVMIEQRAIVNYLIWANHLYFNKVEAHPMALISSIAFDMTLTTLFSPLLRGSYLIVFPNIDTDQLLLAAFKDPLLKAIKLTPSHINLLGKLDLTETTIETIIVGGEMLLEKHVSLLQSLNRDISIYNEYGPTETTVGCSVKSISITDNTISIGKPIANTDLYILDENLTLLPIGTVGELYISGLGLARGYLNNPELTAEKFIVHPFKEGERLYKTGDLARWLPDGNIKFLGRIDHQLKIRGYRIEAGEIEQALMTHTAIQSAVVIGYNIANTKELVAYLVAQETVKMPDITTLRIFLADSLPDYMIPAYFVELEQLPLTSSGKVNRKALPSPDVGSLATGVRYEAPRNSVEQTLVDIWEALLGRKSISIYDNFFAIGGHSLRAIRLLALIQVQLAAEIKLSQFFAQPTIAELAKLIEPTDAINLLQGVLLTSELLTSEEEANITDIPIIEEEW